MLNLKCFDSHNNSSENISIVEECEIHLTSFSAGRQLDVTGFSANWAPLLGKTLSDAWVWINKCRVHVKMHTCYLDRKRLSLIAIVASSITPNFPTYLGLMSIAFHPLWAFGLILSEMVPARSLCSAHLLFKRSKVYSYIYIYIPIHISAGSIPAWRTMIVSGRVIVSFIVIVLSKFWFKLIR